MDRVDPRTCVVGMIDTVAATIDGRTGDDGDDSDDSSSFGGGNGDRCAPMDDADGAI